MFIENLATFADYFLVGKAFVAMYGIGSVLMTLGSLIGLAISSFTTYQAVLAAYTLDVVARDTARLAAVSLRKRFIAINVVSVVYFLVLTLTMHVLNKRWLSGPIKLMYALVLSLLGAHFWYYFIRVVRTARTMAEAVGVKRVQNLLRKALLTTALFSLLILGLLVMGSLDLMDFENPHHGNQLVSYVPVNETLLLLGCTTITYAAWLPLQQADAFIEKTGQAPRCVFRMFYYHHHYTGTHRSHHHYHRSIRKTRKSKTASTSLLRYAARTRRGAKHTHTHTHTHPHTHTHTHIHTHTHTNTYTDIHTHTHKCASSFFDALP
jgi:hypothetical protein